MTTTQLLRAAAVFGAAAGLAALLGLRWANRRRDVEAVDPADGWPEWLTRDAPDRTDAVIPAQRHGGTR